MNKAKFDKEKKNVKLLAHYFTHYGFRLGFWTLMDGLSSRLKLHSAWEHSDRKRYEICKTYLRKNYGEIVEKYQNRNVETSLENISDGSNIWVFWWQGEEQFLYPVDLCIESIKRHSGKHAVVVITKDNLRDYLNLPKAIIEKFSSGRMPMAQFADLIRFELVYKYGGIWLDSTYYLTRDLQEDIYKKPFFSISIDNGRKWVVTQDLWSVSFIAAAPGNPMIEFMCEALRTYWMKEDANIVYLLADSFMAIGYEDIPLFRNMIENVPENNTGVFDLLEPIRNETCMQQEFEKLMGDTYIHKLTYKEKYDAEIKGHKTYFGRLIEN